MIHKVERIVSIGKFRDYRAAGDVSFKKLTLFYADNGSGKTTLTAIFRSLTHQKPEIIIKRLSTNHTTAQSAQIVQRDANGNNIYHTFRPTTGWSSNFPDIEIFDVNFVNENIYSGFEFNEEQKKNLHSFAIGAQGVTLKHQIEQNKTEKAALRQHITNIESNIIQQVGYGLNSNLLTAFLNITAHDADNIDNRILDGEQTLNIAKANNVIKTLQHLIQLKSVDFSIDFDQIIIDLNSTTQTIQDEALKTLFERHCTDLTENELTNSESWLRIGYGYLQSKYNITDEEQIGLQCPFCRQTINNKIDIIKAYIQRFNEEFNAYTQRIQGHLNNLLDLKIDTIIQSLNNVNEINNQRIGSWAIHLPGTVQPPVYNITADEGTLRTELNGLIEILRRKLHKPSDAVTTERASNLLTCLESINDKILAYNQSVTNYNNSINTLLSTIKTEQQAQNELNTLKRVKKRFEPTISALCTSLIEMKRQLRTLEGAYSDLVRQEQEAALTFFTRYKEQINHYLNEIFKTPFRIEDVVHVPPQGRATQSKIGYKLTIDGCDISFDPNQPNSTKDCLSEGDKSTIALALFLAKIDIDPLKANKILIFDDPLSSFDSNRRLYTVKLIVDLLQQIKQVVVLSHNEFFLHEISKNVARGDKKTLRISENFLTRSSIIEPLDLDALVKIDYFKHIQELEDFLQNSDIAKKDRILGLLRNVLEAHICFKFYRQISHIDDNRRTFGVLINEIERQNVTFRSDTNPPSIISKLRLINAISCKPHHGEPTPDYVSLGIDPNTITVAELANFVQDTLDLIDNRL